MYLPFHLLHFLGGLGHTLANKAVYCNESLWVLYKKNANIYLYRIFSKMREVNPQTYIFVIIFKWKSIKVYAYLHGTNMSFLFIIWICTNEKLEWLLKEIKHHIVTTTKLSHCHSWPTCRPLVNCWRFKNSSCLWTSAFQNVLHHLFSLFAMPTMVTLLLTKERFLFTL